MCGWTVNFRFKESEVLSMPEQSVIEKTKLVALGFCWQVAAGFVFRGFIGIARKNLDYAATKAVC